MSPVTLVLGLGNVLLSDEAIGPLVVRQLAQQGGSEGVRYLDGGTLSFTLAEPIGAADELIVVDASIMGAEPGTVRIFEGEAMDRRLRVHAKSVHEVSLADLLDMARLTDTLPRRRALVGIEPSLVAWGDGLSPPMARALPEAMRQVQVLIAAWRAASPGGIPGDAR